MSDSAIRRAREQLVPVDQFTEFIEDSPMCEYCGSYEVCEVYQRGPQNTTRLNHLCCEECGHKTRLSGRLHEVQTSFAIMLNDKNNIWHDREYKKFEEWRKRQNDAA